MKNRRAPILTETVKKIRTLIERNKREKLPSVRVLSLQLGVSLLTIHRALAILKKEGAVESRWGKGYYIPNKSLQKEVNNDASKDTNCLKVNKVKKTILTIKNDIIEGKYQTHQPLPSLKNLIAYYNVSYPTLKKALNSLVEENIIIQKGSRYYFFTNQNRIMAKIIVVAFGTERNSIKIVTEREQNFYRLLSRLAIDNNIFLETVCYNDYLDEPHFYTPNDTNILDYMNNDNINGIILSTYHMKDSVECLRKLLTFNIPISVWVEDHRMVKMIDRYTTNYQRKLCFFDSSYSIQPGFEVGKYLIGKGHKNIAYISPFHESVWSQNRLIGLKKAAKLTPSVNIYPFVNTQHLNEYFFFEEAIKEFPFEKNFFVRKITKKIYPFLREKISSVKYEYGVLLRDNKLFTVCEKLMKEALKNSSIRAWVCANDCVAGLIMDYWNYEGIPLEKRPALVGFDNSFESFKKSITSYEFNTQGEIQQMLNHLLYPNISSLLKSKSSIRVSGRIVERDSSIKNIGM